MPKGALPLSSWAVLAAFWALAGCARRESLVEQGNRTQVLYQALAAEPSDLDPQAVSGLNESEVISCLFEGLTTDDPVDSSPRPGIASSWDISADQRVYTFHLRPAARWSNGRPLTAADFVASYERMLSPAFAASYAYMLYPLKGAEDYNAGRLTDYSQVGARAVDPHTLELTLREPTPYFLKMLSHYAWYPVPISMIEKFGDRHAKKTRWTRADNLVGDGPFVLREWRPNQRLVLGRSRTYYAGSAVSLQGIVFSPIESTDVQERMFRSGQLHRTSGLPFSKVEGWRRDDPRALVVAPVLGTAFLRVNVTQPGLSDLRVRRALGLAIDRERLVRGVLHGGQAVAEHFTPPHCAGYNAPSGITFNASEAARLLAEAGYPGGKGFPHVELLFNTSGANQEVAEVLQQMWRQNLGIDVPLRNQEWKVYLATLGTRDHYLALGNWYADYVDPQNFLDLWTQGSGTNDTNWALPAYERLLARAQTAVDTPARYGFYRDAEALLLKEMPIIPLYFHTQVTLTRPEVKGWRPNALGTTNYRLIHLEAQTGAPL